MVYVLPTLLALLALTYPATAAEPPVQSSPPGLVSEQDRLAKEFQDLKSAGKLDAAITAAEKLIEADRKLIATKLSGPDGGNALTVAKTNLYDVLSWLVEQEARRGNYTGAVRCQRDLAEFAEGTFGNDDDRAFEARRDVAYREKMWQLNPEDAQQLVNADQAERSLYVMVTQGKLAEAVAANVEGLKSRQRLLGKDDSRTARSVNILGVFLVWQKEFSKAELLFRRALAVEDKASSRGNSHSGAYLINLASVLVAQSKLDDAVEYYRRAAAICERLAATNVAYRSTAETTIQSLLGILQRQAGSAIRQEKWDSAKKAVQEVLTIQLRRFGPQHWRTTNARLEVIHLARIQALTLDQRKDLADADTVWQKASNPKNCSNPKDRLRLAEQMLVTYEKVFGVKAHETASALMVLESVYYDQGTYAHAEPLCRQALEIRKAALGEAHPDYAASLNNLAGIYWAQGNYARAEPLYRQASDILKKLLGENHPDYAQSLTGLAHLYQDQGDYGRAEPVYRQALDIRKKVFGDNRPEYAGSLTDLALLYQAQGDYARAALLYRQALEVRKKAFGKKHSDYAASLGNLAYLYQAQGDCALAVTLCHQSLEIYKKVVGEGHPDYAKCLNNLAGLYKEQGDYARAEPLYRQASEIFRNVFGKNHPNYALSLSNLAVLYGHQGRYTLAEPLCRQALEIQKKVLGESHPDYANSLNNLAGLYWAQGDYSRAEPLYRQTSEILKKALGENHRDYATSLNNLAALYWAQGDYSRAELLLHQSLYIKKTVLGENHPDYAMSLNNLGLLYWTQGDYVRAEPLQRQAVLIHRRQLEATAVVQSERQQLAMLQSARFYLDGYLALTTGQNQFSASAYQQMLAWKGTVFRRQRLARAGEQTPELMAIFRKLQQVAGQLAKQAWATPDPKQETHWRENVERLSAEKERLEAELSDRSAAYRQAKKQVTLEELQQALPKDTVMVDILQYNHLTPPDRKAGTKGSWQQRLSAFVVRRDGPLVRINLGPAQSVSESIDTWRMTFGMSPQGATAGRWLRQKLWEPVEAQLGGAKIVLVSPDGAVSRLPLGALPGKEPGKYLIEDYALTIIPTAQVIPEIVQEQGRKELRRNLLLLGNIDYDAQPGKSAPAPAGSTQPTRALPRGFSHFDRLPGTADEVDAITRLYQSDFGREGITTLAQTEASKRSFLAEAGQHRYLHLATHGFFVEEKLPTPALLGQRGAERFGEMLRGPQTAEVQAGLLSGLALAGANHVGQAADALAGSDSDDGILTAEELGTQNLDGVQLVVLSACETGLGKAAAGEGLLGLQRAFQSAGARTVVASLWSVPDEETRMLMEEFYTNLWRRKQGALDSLRQAQLAMLHCEGRAGRLRGAERDIEDDHSGHTRLSPRYWAAFVLSGDWR
jgi:CHAT domain-containing protein/Tfp pilus assembly protein PilF